MSGSISAASPNWPGSKWQQLDDGSYGDQVEVRGSPAFVELDFGIGGQETTKVRVVNVYPYTQYYDWLNGATLFVMDDARNVILTHTFSNITSANSHIFDFSLQI